MKLLLSTFLLVMCALTVSAQAPIGPQMPLITPGVSHDLAIWRAAHYSDIRYKLNLTLEKMSPILKGTIEIRVKVKPQPEPPGSAEKWYFPNEIVLDWRRIRGSEKLSTISNVSINGTAAELRSATESADQAKTYDETGEHLIFQNVPAGENVIKLDFTSPILTSGSAITRYIDKEDGSEYLYSLFVPSDASTAFPVFDQPDLKARFTLNTSTPDDWRVISNAKSDTPFVLDINPIEEELEWQVCGENDKCHQEYKKPQHHALTGFFETKPISTYVFAFAAGPWQEFSEAGVTGGNATVTERAPSKPARTVAPADNSATQVEGTLPNGRVSARTDTPLDIHYYVRKSQAAKFQPHAAEVFGLTREGVKYLEDYFDYKFPWPKYDLVLIPEFPFGGMEHAGATFLSERGIIFPSEPTANDYISRANLIFHETAHQWFGDTVTMKWFDDLWLKEGFAEFMAYKTLEAIMPQYNAWKAFYERNKQAAYLTDSTKGTTPIYQPIENLSAAKSAYGNIVYRKAPSFLRQAEFYLGAEKFQTAVRAFLKKHAFANATWQDLVSEFKFASGQDLKEWAEAWVKTPGVPIFHANLADVKGSKNGYSYSIVEEPPSGTKVIWPMRTKLLTRTTADGRAGQYDKTIAFSQAHQGEFEGATIECDHCKVLRSDFIFANYQDYGYGIFLLDPKSRDYVLKNIQNERDDFLRSMMWGSLWDSVREAELDPREYVELAIKNLPAEKDETITASVLNRVSTAMTYYLPEPTAPDMQKPARKQGRSGQRDDIALTNVRASAPSATNLSDLQSRLEALLIDRMRLAPTLGQRITYYRAFLNIVSTANGRNVLTEMLRTVQAEPLASASGKSSTSIPTTALPPANAGGSAIPLKTKDRFDIVTRLAILGDPEAPTLLADLEKTEISDDAKRYSYAAHAAFATKENKEKFWNDFVNNKDISESWIEAAMGPFNSPKHSDLSLPYLQRALTELPNLKRNRKIFFVNGWLGAFIGGQKSQEALDIVNKFLADNPNLDKDLRLKILENVDIIERAVKIRNKYGQNHLR
jgi:aminopeptidase N